MYHIRFNCINLAQFNDMLVLKRKPITESEILEACAVVSLYHNANFSCANNAQYDKAVEGIVGFIKLNNLLEPTIYNLIDDLVKYFLEDYEGKLSIEQLEAINDYCVEQKYTSESELLSELKKSGVLDERSPLEDLAEQVKDNTYYGMYYYLKGY